jgi:hypothetical protein
MKLQNINRALYVNKARMNLMLCPSDYVMLQEPFRGATAANW